MEANIPYRLTPRGMDPSALEAANEGRTGAARLEPVDQAVERASSQKSAVPDRIWSWVEHPDERVLLAFLSNRRCRDMAGSAPGFGFLGTIRDAVFTRAQEQAQEEGVLWTPLFDRFVGSQLWETRYTPPASNWRAVPKSRLGDLVAWATEQPPEAVEPLLDGTASHELRAALLGQCALSDDAFRAHLADAVEWGEAVAGNPQLTAPQARALARWAVDLLDSWAEGREEFPHLREARSAAARTLYSLADEGWEVPGDVKDRLLEHALDGEDREVWREGTRLVLAQCSLSPAETRRLFRRRGKDMDVAAWLARYPAPPLAIVRKIARRARRERSNRLHRALSEHPEAVRDPAIREQLLELGYPDVLPQLAPAATLEEIRRILERVAPWSSGHTIEGSILVQSILRADPSVIEEVKREDVDVLVERVRERRGAAEAALALAMIPAARQDPAVRSTLLQFPHIGVLRELVRSLRGEGQREAFLVLLGRWDLAALRLLEERSDGLRESVRPEDLEPLLACDDGEVRTRAIMALGHLQPRPQRAPPTPTRGSP